VLEPDPLEAEADAEADADPPPPDVELLEAALLAPPPELLPLADPLPEVAPPLPPLSRPPSRATPASASATMTTARAATETARRHIVTMLTLHLSPGSHHVTDTVASSGLARQRDGIGTSPTAAHEIRWSTDEHPLDFTVVETAFARGAPSARVDLLGLKRDRGRTCP
jgi:hypothetical protein